MKDLFRKIATKVSQFTGTASVFIIALSVVVLWAVTGPVFNFSNAWQLFINTFTTISTFLMVFLIQNTQNRESKAMQIKLDELITHTTARDGFVDVEDMTDDELEQLYEEFKQIHKKYYDNHSMHKLHQKIEKAHRQRQSIRGQAEGIIEKLNPLK